MSFLRDAIFLLIAAVCSVSHFASADDPVDFARDIRPLLSDRCFACHGFDDQTREADLGLHTREFATRDLGGYRAIDPDNPEQSELLARITSSDPDEVMPPPSGNKPVLTPEEADLFRRWIEQGAKYEQHWSFQKPVRPEVPKGEAKHPVDRFLDARIASREWEKTEQAAPATLLRRLSFDLRGVPPTTKERELFLSSWQTDPEATWKDFVERFLSSPLYGERWARDWLDLARYADTNGYEKDRPRSIWPYRDWVVKALNADMPYDRFTIEQLAGDMLPNPTTDQLVATGFHRNTMLNEEGGIDPLEFRYHAMVDRVATTGSVWLGLTTGCAQCHTHKFDPITHTDYFAMMALLNNADELEIPVPVEELTKRREKIDQQIAEKEAAALANIDEEKFSVWLAKQHREIVNWIPLEAKTMKSNLPFLQKQDDFSIYASGDFTKRDLFELGFDLPDTGGKPVTAIRIEAIPDERLPANGPGAAYYEGRKGDFFLSEVEARIGGEPVAFRDASVSFGKISVGSGKAVGMNIYDGDGSTGWSTSTQEGKRNELVICFSEPVSTGGRLEVDLLFERHFVAALGRFRISVTTDRGEIKADNSEIPNPKIADASEMRKAYLRKGEDFKDLQKEIAALEAGKPAYPTTLVFQERPEANPRKTHRHHRGEYLSAKEEVEPAVPAVFDPIPEKEPANRLSFAKWLVSDRNPLVARVAVNRAWRAFFGTGILKTSGDFGYQSEIPTHPELLDWLAVEFVESGWSMKNLHRLIVTSEAYRRDSRMDSSARERDPENRFLARGPRFRLTGEMLRDSVLQASGLLSPKVGGPGVYPPQPGSVTEMAYGKTAWKVSEGEDRYRRSLYTFAKRTAPFAAYLTFDGPTGESCLPRRDRSNTPLQALTLLNDPMFSEASEALAREMVNSGPDSPGQMVDDLFRRILTRDPDDRERADFVTYFQKQQARFAAGELKSEEILREKEQANSDEVAAWKMVIRVLFNLSESVTRS
ncbi:MAG: PSD1 and planctomycete cytochrome C domain-containing protein [Verrucomicrobiales bacterium]|nr:PSD1 and planctomycete cytochrome C domain-containing protein [Verrucomicrobiales bacterium]